ncbi:uncharacterized protein LOC143706387 isoform X2 [Siphateles boraxobius]|uniref:uncharacterized protein LOC143706387 isoform X2 n=1 Tax=Siphateles boraxobius TaxID=180520 RepID=UPI00406281F5
MIAICDHKLLIFLLMLIMSVLACETTKIFTVTGYEGGNAEIRCPYESGYEEKNKYLCRGECKVSLLNNKDIPVESGSPAKDRRFSLSDNRTTRIFTVTITDLRTEDQGQYWCGVRTGYLKLDKFKEINLEIKPVFHMSGVTGQHLNISCHYNSDLKNKIKFMCKGNDPSLCETSAIKVSSERNRTGRFSLRDDESAVFTVTITDLTLEDSGIYWCGAGERRQKNKWISVTHLHINNGTSATISSKPTTTATVYTSKPATEDSASIRPITSVFPLSSSTTSHAVSLSFSSSNNASQPGSGFTMFIMLVVIGTLIGFGFSLFMYFRWRQKKEGKQPKDDNQGPTEHLPNRDMKPNREVSHTVSDYDEISNTLDHPDYSLVFPVFDEHDTSVYALAQLPSSPSDNLNYSTVRFSSHLSDRTSDGQDTYVYATAGP